MRAKKYPNIGYRPNEKARTYLEQTGFLDGRNGRKKDKEKNLNRVMNYAIIQFFERGAPGFLDTLDPVTLRKMFCERMISIKQDEIQGIAKEMRELNKELLQLDGRDLDAEEAEIQRQARLKTELHNAGLLIKTPKAICEITQAE